jgi:hypothetical protein
MKFSIIGLLLSFISIKSCEKINNACDCKLEGLWFGTYSVDQVPQQGKLPYNFIFKPDGTLVTEGNGGDGVTYYSSGTWQLNGDQLNCTYTTINFPYGEVVQSASFIFNIQNCELKNGKWKDEKVGNYSGSYSLNRLQ